MANYQKNPVGKSSRPVWLGEDSRGWDHFRIHLTTLKDPDMNAYDFCIYCGLVAHAEIRTGECHPSTALLASYFSISERTVQKSVKHLVEIGYIRLEKVPGKANRYFILPPPNSPKSEKIEQESYPHPRTTDGGSYPHPRTTFGTPPHHSAYPDLIYTKQDPYNNKYNPNPPNTYKMVNSVDCNVCGGGGWIIDDSDIVQKCEGCDGVKR